MPHLWGKNGRSSSTSRKSHPPWRGIDGKRSFLEIWRMSARVMAHSEVTIQITPTSLPSMPTFMGEVAVFAQVLTHTGILKTIQERVRFARARMGTYELIDFVAVLIGYGVSGEATLKAFYER